MDLPACLFTSIGQVKPFAWILPYLEFCYYTNANTKINDLCIIWYTFLRHLVEILILSHSSCVGNIIPDCGSTNIFSTNSVIFRYRAGAPEARLPRGADIEKRTESKIENVLKSNWNYQVQKYCKMCFHSGLSTQIWFQLFWHTRLHSYTLVLLRSYKSSVSASKLRKSIFQ